MNWNHVKNFKNLPSSTSSLWDEIKVFSWEMSKLLKLIFNHMIIMFFLPLACIRNNIKGIVRVCENVWCNRLLPHHAPCIYFFWELGSFNNYQWVFELCLEGKPPVNLRINICGCEQIYKIMWWILDIRFCRLICWFVFIFVSLLD